MAALPDCNSVEEALLRFQAFKDTPCHALFEDRLKVLKYRYRDNNIDDGFIVFRDSITALQQLGTQAVFVVHFYENIGANEKLTMKTPYSGSFTFRVHPYESGLQTIGKTGNIMQQSDQDFRMFLLQERDSLNAKIADLQDENQELREELEELEKTTQASPIGGGKVGAIIDTIGATGERYPWMQESIKDLFTMARHMFKIPGASPSGARAASMAGVPGNPTGNESAPEMIQLALQKLLAYYINNTGLPMGNEEEKARAHERGTADMANDLSKLASLTDDPDVFQLAIKKLRQF
jgi:DNA-binding transcriptional MerR regulator